MKGFTLIELMIVIVLIAVSVGVTSDILTTLVKGYNKTQVMNELEQNANFITSKIKKELLNARDVSTIGGNSRIRITRSNGTEVDYYVSDSKLSRQIGAQIRDVTRYQPNVPGGVYISCSNCFSVSGTSPKRVDVRMSLQQSQSASSQASVKSSVEIYETIVLRSTYK